MANDALKARSGVDFGNLRIPDVKVAYAVAPEARRKNELDAPEFRSIAAVLRGDNRPALYQYLRDTGEVWLGLDVLSIRQLKTLENLCVAVYSDNGHLALGTLFQNFTIAAVPPFANPDLRVLGRPNQASKPVVRV